MIEKLFSVFGIHKIGLITGMASQIVRTFEQEFAKDGDAKNAAIDAIIEMLQRHKDQIVAKDAVTATPTEPIAPIAPVESVASSDPVPSVDPTVAS